MRLAYELREIYFPNINCHLPWTRYLKGSSSDSGLHFSTVYSSGKSSKIPESPENSWVTVHCIIRTLHLLLTHTDAKLIEYWKQFKLPTACSYLYFQFPPDWGWLRNVSLVSPNFRPRRNFPWKTLSRRAAFHPFLSSVQVLSFPGQWDGFFLQTPSHECSAFLLLSFVLQNCSFRLFWSKDFKVT